MPKEGRLRRLRRESPELEAAAAQVAVAKGLAEGSAAVAPSTPQSRAASPLARTIPPTVVRANLQPSGGKRSAIAHRNMNLVC